MNLAHQNLFDLSAILGMIVVIFLFLILFESRYPTKIYLASLIPFMILWVGGNLYLLFVYGANFLGRWLLLTCTLTSLVYFFLVAKHRGGQFFFTFCLVDTVIIWIMLSTNLIDYALGAEGLAAFLLRLILFPLVAVAAWRFGRQPYLDLLHTVSRGWWMFAAMTGLFYATLCVMGGVPVNLRLRPEAIPSMVMVLLLLPLTYITIFRVLRQQQELFQVRERQRTLQSQSAMIERRAEEFRMAEDRLRIQRHDLRHHLQTITVMAQRGDLADILDYTGQIQALLDETGVEHYCANPVLDAILCAYFQRAKGLGIQVEAHMDLPEELPVPAAELAALFANALENMLQAVEGLPGEQRRMVCKCVRSHRLMLEFSNPCPNPVVFGPDGIPVSGKQGHGTGTRSIVAFAEKHHAVYSFRWEEGWFKLQMAV